MGVACDMFAWFAVADIDGAITVRNDDKGVGCGHGTVLMGECLPGARPAHAWRTTFVQSILSLAPSLSPPREVPQVDHTRPQTFRSKHVA